MSHALPATAANPAADASPVDAASEADLIHAAQRGDKEAFGRLVRAHDRDVLRMTQGLLRSPEEARDAYQESFLRAYRNIGRFRRDSSFHTWLYRIVANVCLDQLRRRRARPEGLNPAGREGIRRSPLDTLRETRGGGDPERSLISRQIEERIDDALSDLTPRERLVFELRHHEGLRLKKIGAITGTSELAARNCLWRATRKLRAALGDLT